MNDDQQALRKFLASRNAELDSHEAVFNLIRSAAIVVTVMESAALRPLGLTHAGYRLLLELWVKGPLEPHQLAGFMMVTKPTIVGAVNTLVKAGLVRRLRSTSDRRRLTVALTDAGLERIEKAGAAWREWQQRVTSDLTLEEKRTMAALAERIASTAARARAAAAEASATSAPGDPAG